MIQKLKFLPVLTLLFLLYAFGITSHAEEAATGAYYGMTLAEWDEYVREYVYVNGTTQDHLYASMPYYFVCRYSDTQVVMFYSDYPLQLYSALDYLNYNGVFAYVVFNYNGTGLVRLTTGGNYFLQKPVSSYTVNDLSWFSEDIFLSNHDIYDCSFNTTFFQQTPKAHLTKSVLIPILTVLQLREMTMKEIISLLPLVMLFLVSVIGFWKGWRFLWTLLKGA